MGKGKPTLSQRQTNAAYENNLPPSNLYDNSVPEQSARGSDPYPSNKFTDTAETIVRSLFGPEFLRGMALAIDPVVQYFRNYFMIVPWNRERYFQANGSPYLGQNGKNIVTCYTSMRWAESSEHRELGDWVPTGSYTNVSYNQDPISDPSYGLSVIRDTSSSTRGTKLFGTCYMEIITGTSPLAANTLSWTNLERWYSLDFPDWCYTEYQDYYVIDYRGPANYLGAPFKPSFDGDRPYLYYVMNNLVLDMIRETTPDKPVFKSLYNIAELKDLPQLISGLRSLKDALHKCTEWHFDLSRTDKFLADQYLNFQFGIMSVVQAVQGVLKLPEKAAKKFNHFLKAQGKPSTSRAKRTFKDAYSWDAPWTTSRDLGLPEGEVTNARYSYKSETEVRLTLVQTIKFPPLAVPKLSDVNYRKILGLQPNVKLIYDLIPFTWLIDWFTGLGEYVNLVDMFFQDPQLVHYGFMVAVCTETYTINADVSLMSAVRHHYGDGSIAIDYVPGNPIPVTSSITKKTYYREDLSAFDGVKLFGSSNSGLSDFQTSILGSLLTKLSK